MEYVTMTNKLSLNFFNTSRIHYLNTTDNIQSQFSSFIYKSCPDSFSNHKNTAKNEKKREEKGKGGQHESSLDKAGFYNAAKSVWKSQGTVAKALCVLHSMDYACFRQLDFYAGIPQLCRRTYANPRFWRPILDVHANTTLL